MSVFQNWGVLYQSCFKTRESFETLFEHPGRVFEQLSNTLAEFSNILREFSNNLLLAGTITILGGISRRKQSAAPMGGAGTN
jgi:hypothetical protein